MLANGRNLERIDLGALPPLDRGAFAMVMRGRSMEPAFRDGDTLIFSPSATVKEGDEALIRLKDGRSFLGVFRRVGGRIHLDRHNPRAAGFACDAGELVKAFKVIGFRRGAAA